MSFQIILLILITNNMFYKSGQNHPIVFRWDIPVCGEYNLIQLTVKHTRNKIKYLII